MRWIRKKRVLLVILISFLFLLFFNTNWMSWFYPIHYKDEIRTQAEAYDVDPFLVASIIRVESNYKLSRESKKGAIGLMQLMPDTANWVLEKKQKKNVTMDELKHEPEANIEIGTWYLDYLSDHFDGNPIAAIAAYNAGQGNVGSWIKKGLWDGKLDTINEIPVGETRHYVQRVIYYYNQYKDIYKEF